MHHTSPTAIMRGRQAIVLVAIALLAAVLVGPAALRHARTGAAPVPVGHPGMGFLSNMDVVNDTGSSCQGFDIQIEDITQADIAGTYWGSYGQPTQTDMTFPDGHSGVDIKWQAVWAGSSWSFSTAAGTQEHFGVSVMVPPGVQHLTWLCDPSNTGVLSPYGGTATGNGYTDNTLTNPAPTVQTSVVATPAGEQVNQTIQNGPANAPLPQNAVWYYRYQQNTVDTPDLGQLTPDNGLAVSAMTASQINDALNLVDGGGSESANQPVSNGDGGSVWVVQTYAYEDPTTLLPGPYDDAHTASCSDTVPASDPNNCANFVGPLLSTTILSTNPANGGNRFPVNVNEKLNGTASTVSGAVTSNDLSGDNANPGNVDCTGSCSTVVDTGTQVTLSATANPGYTFAGWAGAGCSGTSTCTVTASAVTNVTANYTLAPSFTAPAAGIPTLDGTTTKVTLHGTGFAAKNAVVSISGTGVTASSIKVSGGTTLKFTATATRAALGGLRDVTITNPGGSHGTCSGCLDVRALPHVTSVTPSSIAASSSTAKMVAVTIAGTSFEPGAKIKLSGTGLKAAVTSISATSIQLNLTVAKKAAAGLRAITITNPDKGVGTASLRIS